MIEIYHPMTYLPERTYVYKVVFEEFLGWEYCMIPHEKDCVEIRLDETKSRLMMCDTLFQTREEDWLRTASLPVSPLDVYDTSAMGDLNLVSPVIPIIYGERPPSGEYFRQVEGRLEMYIDIFGSIFFMLSRYEEVVKNNRDQHHRFTAKASVAYKNQFLTRPIVNEYLELLRHALDLVGSTPRVKRRTFRVRLSHDVDWPLSDARTSVRAEIRRVFGDILSRRSPRLAWARIKSCIQVRKGNLNADLYNTFDFLMDVSEQYGLKSAFYFMTDAGEDEYSASYSLTDPWIGQLMRHISGRGHEIGLHASYDSFRDPNAIEAQFSTLRQRAEKLGVNQTTWGGRHHYLRWQVPISWQSWEDAGLDYDSTVGFADVAGFRSGVCYEYPVFNLHTRQMLRLRERPLVVMEATLLEKKYMNVSLKRATDVMGKLLLRCRQFNGEFTLLWHNDRIAHPRQANLFRDMVCLGSQLMAQNVRG